MNDISKNKRSINSIFRKYFFIVAISSVFVIGIVSILLHFYSAKSEIRHVEQRVVEQQKNNLRSQIANIQNYIKYKREQVETVVKKNIKERVYDAYDIINYHYEEHKNELPTDDLHKHIIDTIRPIRFFSGRGYYFITRLDGQALLFADRPEFENKNILSSISTDGKYVVKDMIDIAVTKGEGFYSYEWTKPDMPGRNHKKIAFVKYYAPLNAYIGAGEYLSDVESDIKSDVLDFLTKIKLDNEGYVFAGDWKGVSLAGPAKGRNMINVQDKTGIYIVKELIDLSKRGGGFLEYEMPPLDGKKNAPKISYVEAVDAWKWYIGIGAYKEDIASIVKQKIETLKRTTYFHVVIILLALIVSMTISFAFAKMFERSLSENIEIFDKFFRSAIEGKVLSDVSKIEFSEFNKIAALAEDMIKEKKSLEETILHTEKMYSLGAMAAGMAHEINNPLSAVLQGVQNIKRRLDPELRKNIEAATDMNIDFADVKKYCQTRGIVKFADIVEEAGLRASIIVSSMLSFSRKSGGKKSKILISDIIERVLLYAKNDFDLQIGYDFNDIDVLKDIDVNVNEIVCIENELEQVVFNMVKNAAYAVLNNDKDVTPTITLRTFLKNEQIVIEIEDNGTGIDSQSLKHIFNPFFTTKPVGAGTGLGLSVSYFIVKKHHHGDIAVESELGKGTVFRIYLPREFEG